MAKFEIDALNDAQRTLRAADDRAREVLCAVLERFGEDGLRFPTEYCEGEYQLTAEPRPGCIVRVEAARCYGGQLQVFIEGRWAYYWDAIVDTWFLVDNVVIYLENEEE